MRIWLVLGLMGMSFWASEAAAAKMTMADLKALAKSGSHDELLAHAKDIPPAKRDDGWNAMVETAAVGSLDAAGDGQRATFQSDDLLQQFPHLKGSRTYMDKRAEVGLKGFEACYKRSWSGVNCTERLVTFVKTDANNSKLAVDAGNLMIKNQFPYVSVRVYRFAVLDRKGRPAACDESELKRGMEAALENLLDDDPIKKDAIKMKAVCSAPASKK